MRLLAIIPSVCFQKKAGDDASRRRRSTCLTFRHHRCQRLRNLAGRREGRSQGPRTRLPEGMNSENGFPSTVDHHVAVSRDRGFVNTTYVLLFAIPSTFTVGCSVVNGADRVRQSRIRQVARTGFHHELNAVSRHGTRGSRPILGYNVDCGTVLSEVRPRRNEISWQSQWPLSDTLPAIIIRECPGECPRSVDPYRCRRCRRCRRRAVVCASAGSESQNDTNQRSRSHSSCFWHMSVSSFFREAPASGDDVAARRQPTPRRPTS